MTNPSPQPDTEIGRYFDYAGSAPPWPEALAAQQQAARAWYANPSALHKPGETARQEFRKLKLAFAGLCGFRDGRVVLTSGATEANNLVIHGVLSSQPDGRILVAADTHASVWNSCALYKDRLDVIPLTPNNGRIPVAVVAAALRPDTRLVCLSHAANETGVVHEVSALADLCARRHVLCLVDGVQALGHLPVDLAQIPCDFYTFSAHKFGGPRGVGGLLLRSDACRPILDGGPQEWGLRPGTENLPGLAGAVEALRLSIAALPQEIPRLRGLTALLLDQLGPSGLRYLVNGNPAAGLPGLLSLSFPGLNGHTLVTELALRGYAAATGSACHADKVEPSRVILALGRSPEEALGTVRLSFGRLTTEAAVRDFATVLADVVQRQLALR